MRVLFREAPHFLITPRLPSPFLAPVLVAQSRTLAGFQFSFTTVPGYRYTPQFVDSLSASNQWTDLAATNATGSAATMIDPVPDDTRLYRLLRQPLP